MTAFNPPSPIPPNQNSLLPQTDAVRSSEGYDLWARDYDSFNNPMLAMVDLAWSLNPWPLHSKRVMELGCGTGRNLQRILSAGAVGYTGIDSSREMLSRAQNKTTASHVRWLYGDIQDTPDLPPASCDAILICLVLEHLADLSGVFSNAARLLVPGGSIRILEIHPTLVAEGTRAHFWHEGKEIQLPSYLHTADEITPMMTRNGVDAAAVTCWFANDDAIARCPKLKKHRGKPALLEWRGTRNHLSDTQPHERRA